MYLGRLCEIAPSDLLYETPAHHYTAALLASAVEPDPEAPRTSVPPSPASPRARSTRRRAAASAPAARGPRPAAPRRSPKCGRSAPATRWPATSPSALEQRRRGRAGPDRGPAWPSRPAPSSPTCTTTGPCCARAGRRRGRRRRRGLERPRRRLGRLRPRAGQRRLGQHPSRRRIPGLGGRRRRLRRARAQLPRHAALEHRQALPARPGAGRRPDRADAWVEPGADGDDVAALALPTGEIVVKPSVSGGGYRTARYEPHEHEAARAHVARAAPSGRTAMVQPYEPRVDTEGETALVFIGGRFSHAMHKDPMIRRGVGPTDRLIDNQVVTGARRPPPSCRGRHGPWPRPRPSSGPTTYARVDMVETRGRRAGAARARAARSGAVSSPVTRRAPRQGLGRRAGPPADGRLAVVGRPSASSPNGAG